MAAHHEDTLTRHPVEVFLASVRDGLKTLADTPLWSMDAAATDRVVMLAAQVSAGVAELEARAVAHAGVLDRPGDAGCRDLKRWLQQLTRVTGRTAAQKVTMAGGLERCEDTRVAMARGEVHAEQATAIARVLDGLDADAVGVGDRHRAEGFLLDHASDHDADDLTGFGREIAQRLDPEGADEREARALEAAAERARTKTTFSMRTDRDGLAQGRFAIPAVQAAMLRKALTALAAPKHVRAEHGAGSDDWQTPTPQRMGQAFCEYVERYPVDGPPRAGGLAATVVVVGDLDTLEGEMKAARLDTGELVSPGQFVRMACEAGIVPAWMNADGECLALGRTHRFHTPRQRLAKTVETDHCEHVSGCTVPAYLCHLHHRQPWSRGGRTDLRDADLLCPFHHAAQHRDARHLDDGTHPRRT